MGLGERVEHARGVVSLCGPLVVWTLDHEVIPSFSTLTVLVSMAG